ncbi:hypothetical protein ACEN8K_18965 [Variovorax sp. CT11-76]
MVLPLVDAEGQRWQSEEISAAIAEVEGTPAEITADLELEPLAPSHRGFEYRLPPVTQEERLLAADRAHNRAKASPDYRALPLAFELAQQNGRSA